MDWNNRFSVSKVVKPKSEEEKKQNEGSNNDNSQITSSNFSTTSNGAVKMEMMAGKKKDELHHIYEDIADHFKQSHFKRDPFDMDKKTYRHQRYTITGFRVLIPVGKKVDNDRMLNVCVE